MEPHKAHGNPLFLREEELRASMDLLFFAVNDFNAKIDPLLAEQGLGRAHFRALYFIGGRPGLTVGELIATLKVTKQSLARVLRDLTDKDYIRVETARTDRRQRCLHVTPSGAELERQLSQAQKRRLAAAYKSAGAQAVEGFRTVLMGLLPDDGPVSPGRRGGR